MKKKRALTLTAALSAAALLLTGTFAWQQMISKTNEFIGQKDGVTVHDDFDPKTGAKDVYVENPSEKVVFVRVKLDEAMDLTSNTWRPTASDWQAHTYEENPLDCGHANTEGKYFHDYFSWIMGGQKYYKPTDGSQQVVQDTTVYDENEPGVKQTPPVEIIKAAEYLTKTEAEQASFVGWIYDTDGYAYWSRPLSNGDVTGLLLHKVNRDTDKLKDINYYYAIDVKVEAVDEDDLPMWLNGLASVDGSGTTYAEATTGGKAVISRIAELAAGSGEESGLPEAEIAEPVEP